jgi:hypothetical protein
MVLIILFIQSKDIVSGQRLLIYGVDSRGGIGSHVIEFTIA